MMLVILLEEIEALLWYGSLSGTSESFIRDIPTELHFKDQQSDLTKITLFTNKHPNVDISAYFFVIKSQ